MSELWNFLGGSLIKRFELERTSYICHNNILMVHIVEAYVSQLKQIITQYFMENPALLHCPA